MRLRVAAMPAGEDPAEMMAAEGGAERFRDLVDKSGELTEFQVGLVLDRTDVSTPVQRDRALAEVAPILAGMGPSISRDELVRRVAERLETEPATVLARMTVATPTSGGPEAAEAGGYQGRNGSSAQEAAPSPRRAAALTSREVRERALLAMCIALPEQGPAVLERLTDAHLSPSGQRAAAWLRAHPGDPASDLPRDDDELSGLIAELVMTSREQPASPLAMELNFLQLDQRRLENEIAAAGERGDYERRAALSRERAALVERIAHAQQDQG
jgi:DNA primase